MIRLNTNQETHLIRYMINHPDLFIDNGASRAVFHCTTDIADYLHLPEKADGRYIMKVAMGRGGVEQMKVEVETYLDYEDYHVLAEIVAVGRYVEIMEAVEVWDFRDEADNGYTADDFVEAFDELTQSDGEDIEHTIEVLNDLFGYTSDNGQIGKNSRGWWVAYDYGYIPGKGNATQTSDISDVICRDSARKEYLKGLLDLLDEEEDFMEQWEKTFLGIDDEEEEECDDPKAWEDDTEEQEKDLDFSDDSLTTA